MSIFIEQKVKELEAALKKLEERVAALARKPDELQSGRATPDKPPVSEHAYRGRGRQLS